ncbi:MAG: 50S ribosomal protein L2 [Oligoflexia bacterium]|nr:50S ribosomal protein L2 [Oligoflexia bacterium]
MSVKRFNPKTPAQRKMTLVSSAELTKKAPEKSLLAPLKSSVARNNSGRITTRHRGGGFSKRKYRIVDFKRNKQDIEAVVKAIEYDPNRNCRIALISYRDGTKSYIISPLGLNVGDVVIASDKADIKVGNVKKMKDIPIGTLIHNIELYPGAGGQIARSAGAYAQLMAKEGAEALIRLPSNELRKVKIDCRATIGQVGNIDYEQVIWGKAGKSRIRGIRPTVRGVAMNPIDHPHGGGEGRTSGGRHPVTPWGLPTRGYKTRNNKRTDKRIIKKRK